MEWVDNMNKVPTPYPSAFSKFSFGLSDTTITNNTMHFMGCSVTSATMNIGYNGTASSLQLTLVEDTVNGDSFVEPNVPSLWAFSLPKGGVGAKILYNDGEIDLNPKDMGQSNVPFYFCGICTSYSKNIINAGGRQISVSFTDVRDLMNGVQCLLSGFSLSQNIGAGASRYTKVDNVIDIFGYFNYGMESERSHNGMKWSKIKEAIEGVQVIVHGISLEFMFTGECFLSAPSWYSVGDDITSLLGLCQKVATDGGSDIIIVSKKVADNHCLVEIRGIRRKNVNPLTQQDVSNFIKDRADIVSIANIGKEFRNEPTSAVIFGGPKISNYVAWPTTYNADLHHLDDDISSTSGFPSDISSRLFTTDEGSGLYVGAIFPFWGIHQESQNPLVEPFLSLDHLVFSKQDELYADIYKRMPLCHFGSGFYQVRDVEHTDVFLEKDGDPDQRPFAIMDNYLLNASPLLGWTRGIPLNSVILQAMVNEEEPLNAEQFEMLYNLYYPDIAENLGFVHYNFNRLFRDTEKAIAGGQDRFGFLRSVNLKSYLDYGKNHVIKDDPDAEDWPVEAVARKDYIIAQNNKTAILDEFKKVIFDLVKQYAGEYVGKQFIVCLPKSTIMNRIWSGLTVPTEINAPEIEYQLADYGYWEVLPNEFDGLYDSASEREKQIRSKFMQKDGRFAPMVVIDHKPYGNASISSNGKNKVLLQNLGIDNFRPNKITGYTGIKDQDEAIGWVCCSPRGVQKITTRPDLAIVLLPSQIIFDRTDQSLYSTNDVFNIPFGIRSTIKTFQRMWQRIDILKEMFDNNAEEFTSIVSHDWAWKAMVLADQNISAQQTEVLMDLKAVILPLQSTWVTYGPWYDNTDVHQGKVEIRTEDILVPWNFPRPSGAWDENLDTAGKEMLERTRTQIDYVDTAEITVAGYSEIGLGQAFGFNGHLTNINTNFGVGGITTTYVMSTYSAKPGTYRKSDYDKVFLTNEREKAANIEESLYWTFTKEHDDRRDFYV